MGLRHWIGAACVGGGLFGAGLIVEREAAAQPATIPPIVKRDSGWNTVSNASMIIGATAVLAMPRVYYSDPVATVGWKGRWHFSVLAPAMTMTALTLFVDGPVRNGIKSPRPGCTVDQTFLAFPAAGCESFGGPSTQTFASWGATGAGLGIFLTDTFKYSSGRFNVPYFLGQVMLPLTASVFTTIGRVVEPSDKTQFESGGQVLAGGLTGLGSGLLLGVAYAMFQRPNCGYGNALFCW